MNYASAVEIHEGGHGVTPDQAAKLGQQIMRGETVVLPPITDQHNIGMSESLGGLAFADEVSVTPVRHARQMSDQLAA